MDLGVGDAGVVIDDGVYERGPDQGVVTAVSWLVFGGSAVLVTFLASHVAPPSAVGDVAQLLDVHVQHRPGVGVLVAPDRFAGDPVDVGKPVEPTTDQHRLHRRGGDPQLVADRDRPQALFQR